MVAYALQVWSVGRVRDIFVALLERDPCPTPAETLALVIDELHTRTDNPEYDMTRVAVQTWAEALRDQQLHGHARARYRDALDHIVGLTMRWRDAGHIPADAGTKAVAATIFSLMHGLIVMHHLVEDVPADVLLRGVSSLGAATDKLANTTIEAYRGEHSRQLADLDRLTTV